MIRTNRIISIILLLTIIFMVNAETAFADGFSSQYYSSKSSSDAVNALALIKNQSFTPPMTADKAEAYMKHFINSTGKYVKAKNSGGYKKTATDGTYTAKFESAKKGCAHYAAFITFVMYKGVGSGSKRPEKVGGKVTPESLKELMQTQAQAGEWLTFGMNEHSLSFVSCNDEGFYTLQYYGKSGDPILSFSSYKYFAGEINRSGWDFRILNVDKAVNQVKKNYITVSGKSPVNSYVFSMSQSTSPSLKLAELAPGTIVTIEKEVTNSVGNKWGKIAGKDSSGSDRYIAMDRLTTYKDTWTTLSTGKGTYVTKNANTPVYIYPSSYSAEVKPTISISAANSAVNIVETVNNNAGNTWGRIKDGEWVYMPDLIKVSDVKTYTVTYNANGGSGAPGSQTKTENVDLKLSSTAPTRSGYTFSGWGTSASAAAVSYASGATYKNNANITLYAVWKAGTAPPFTVKATASPSSGTTNDRYTYTVVTSAAATKITYSFNGNSTLYTLNANGTKNFNAGTGNVSSDKKTWTWTGDKLGKGNRTITITAYDANGKTAKTTLNINVIDPNTAVAVTDISLNISSVTINVGVSGTLTPTISPSNATDKTVTFTSSKPEIVSVGKTTGKMTAVSEGRAVITATAHNGVKTTCSVTVTAPDQTGTVTIKYNANGGTGAPNSQTVKKTSDGGTSYTLSTTTPTRTGYTFVGWRLENSTAYGIDAPGQSISIGLGTATSNETVTYYAQWVSNSLNKSVIDLTKL